MFLIYLIVDPVMFHKIKNSPEFFNSIEDLKDWAESKNMDESEYVVWAIDREDYQTYKISQTRH
jgi:hypothetical protein